MSIDVHFVTVLDGDCSSFGVNDVGRQCCRDSMPQYGIMGRLSETECELEVKTSNSHLKIFSRQICLTNGGKLIFQSSVHKIHL